MSFDAGLAICWREQEGEGGRVGRIRMYFRSEASGALLQLVSQGRREFKAGCVEESRREGEAFAANCC